MLIQRPLSLLFFPTCWLLRHNELLQQFNGIRVYHRKETRCCEPCDTPLLMGLNPAKPSRPVWQLALEELKISLQKAVEGAKRASFYCFENPYRHPLARIQFGLALFFDGG